MQVKASPIRKTAFLALMTLTFLGWTVFSQSVAKKPYKILILGDSLTEGYGVEKEDAFPARLEIKLKRWQERFQVINGGSSGSTSASGVRRLKWYGKSEPNLVILALGSNDGLRGVKPEETQKNVEATLVFCRDRKWSVILAGLKVPPNYGKEFSVAFEKIYPELAKKYHLPLIDFLLEGVAGEVTLNQNDGLHPNEKGHEKIAENLFKFLKPILMTENQQK
jgi:acyl-CoA thioesterase I